MRSRFNCSATETGTMLAFSRSESRERNICFTVRVKYDRDLLHVFVLDMFVARALEMFIQSLILKSSETTAARNAKTLTPSHM